MPVNAKLYVALVSAAGTAAMVYAFVDTERPHDLGRLCAYFLLSLLAATLKLRLPGVTGTMSVGFVFVLLGISELTLAETMLIACTGVIVQCLWKATARPAAVQVLFNVSAVAASLLLAYECVLFVRSHWHAPALPVALAVATCVYFSSNSLLVSGVLSLVHRAPLRVVWPQCYLFAFPYHLLGGALVTIMAVSGHAVGWKPPLLLLPVMGLAFLGYRIYLVRPAMPPATHRA